MLLGQFVGAGRPPFVLVLRPVVLAVFSSMLDELVCVAAVPQRVSTVLPLMPDMYASVQAALMSASLTSVLAGAVEEVAQQVDNLEAMQVPLLSLSRPVPTTPKCLLHRSSNSQITPVALLTLLAMRRTRTRRKGIAMPAFHGSG